MDFAVPESNVNYQPSNAVDTKKHTLSPVSTGQSVIALTFNNGVIIASDTQISYGGTAKYKNQNRIQKINNQLVIASTGELSDYQEIVRQLQDMESQVQILNDGIKYTPKDYANYLSRLQYQHRNKFNPLFANNIMAGFNNGKPYLAKVDLYGCLLEDTYHATGYGFHMCKPVICNNWNPQSSEEQVRKVLIDCFKILFYRDCRTNDKIQIAVVDQNGVRIDEPFVVDSQWDYQFFVKNASEKYYV